MKLPFDFALKFIFRMVLPGALLTALFWPILVTISDCLSLTVPKLALIPVCILLLGWLVILFDMQIYMIAEGRKFWPDWLRKLRTSAHQQRVAKMEVIANKATPLSFKENEFSLQIRQYPLQRDGTFKAVMPTRLGNLIYASETYPDLKYGIDGVFAWPRLWVSIDKDLRGELDDRQALVDSSLYAAAIAFLTIPVCGVYALLQYLSVKWVSVSLPPVAMLGGIAIFAAVSGLFLYNAAVYAQIQYGELFCAVFDQSQDKLDYPALVEGLGKHMGDQNLQSAPSREKNRAIVRFLKWHKYRPVGEKDNVDVKDWTPE
jgi:hypothetical protein